MKKFKKNHHDHRPENIDKRLSMAPNHSYLRDWVYGGIDGAVTTFAVIAGVVGANLNIMVILILGITTIVADGFAMAAANFLGTKAERDEYRYYENLEREHIKDDPDGESHEVRKIYANKGFTGDTLDKIVNHLTGNHKLWLHTMLREEHGLPHAIRSPWRAAYCTFFAFLLCGFVPLLPFICHLPSAFLWASVFTGIVFFGIGSLKSFWSVSKWWRSGSVTFFVGASAAILAYVIGKTFRLHLL